MTVDRLVLPLVSGRGFDDTADDGVARIAHHAHLVAKDARADRRRVAGGQLSADVGVGNLRSRHLHGITCSVADRPVRLIDIDDGALCET